MTSTALLLTSLLLGLADAPLQRIELMVPGRVVVAVPADVDGDGDRDVLVIWRQGFPPRSRGRISVFPVHEGRVAEKTTLVTNMPAGTVAFDVGDADGDGRTDILLLMGDGVWCLSGQPEGGLSAKPVQLIEAMTLAAFPNQDHVPPMRMLVDLDGRGRRAILIPTVPIGPMALYVQSQDGKYQLGSMLRVPARSNVYTSAEDVRAARDFSSTFQVTMPHFRVADQDGDGRRDLLFLSRDQVVVFRARPDGSFPEKPQLRRLFGLVTDEEQLQRGVHIRGEAADFNGDGRVDLVFNKAAGGIANMRNEAWVFIAGPKGGYGPKPDVRIAGDGFGASAKPLDVNGDGRLDLVRPYVQVGIMALSRVLLTGKLDVFFHVHLSNAGKPSQRPEHSLASSLAVNFQSNQELSGPYPIFERDFDGDGVQDVLIGQAGGGSGAEPDSLELYPGLPAGGYDDAIWKLELTGTRYVQPYTAKDGDPTGLLIAFPGVEGRKGDVWVLTQARRGGLEK